MKRTVLKPISKKKQRQLREERKIRKLLEERADGVCEECGLLPDLKDGRGELHLSHTIPRSRGGETSLVNCQMLCRKCHNAKHGIIEK